MPSPDDLLFAEHVVKAGFLTRDEVEESLSVQRRMEEMGVHDSLRNVLVKRGALREGDAAIVGRAAGLRSGGEPIPGYTLEARLGTGAMGSVYKAWQKGMKRHVAIKILRRDLTDDPRQVERLQREAALVGGLSHPNIVRGLDSGETDGLVWFVMELVEGETLRERITRLGRLDAAEAIRVTRQIAEALEHAAAHGVVHRDVKPGNILVAKDGTPRLTDYGLAKGESDDALTQLDATLGTPQYISPEQARNPRDADIRSDIYSLGATLYATLTGHPPFAGETMAATLTKVLYERPKPLAEEAPETPPALAYVVERMMAKDRVHRYQTPAELLRDLRALEEGRLVVPAGFKGDIGEFVETRRHRRLWLAGAALVLVAVTIAAGVLVWEQNVSVKRRREEAAHELASLRQLAGPPEKWDGETVQKMLLGLERIGRDYAGTPAAEEALLDVKHWAAQEAELRGAQELTRKAVEPPIDWPRVASEISRRLAELRDAKDATVAQRRLTSVLANLRERRNDHAAAEWDAAKTALAADVSLDQAAQRLDATVETIQRKYFGDDVSPLVAEARVLASRFRGATGSLDRHFAEYERLAFQGGGLARGEFRSLETALEAANSAAQQDQALGQLLASLPPQGTRVSAVADRRDRLRRQLVDESAAAWEKVRRDADDRRGRGDHAGAVALLEQFAATALDAQRDKAVTMRDDLLRLHQGAESAVKQSADETWTRFREALGRRDYARAGDTLSELEAVASAASGPANPAAELVAGGRRLLELIDRHAWKPLRARFARSGTLEHGLSVRSGQGYIGFRDVHDVRVQGRELTFTSEVGKSEKSSLDDVALSDVFHYAGLEPSDAERAMVVAAMRLAELPTGLDPAERLRQLVETAPILDLARAAQGVQPVFVRLANLLEDLRTAARGELAEAESHAEDVHRMAQQALVEERFDTALLQLQSLLDVKTFFRTDYVKKRRDEIARQRDAAAQGRQRANFAAHFPGALFSRTGEGGEVFFDFEHPAFETGEGRKLLGLVEGRTEIASRPGVVANRPDLVRPGTPAGLPIVIEHVLAWRAADAAGSPREFPVTVDCPFVLKSKVVVSFLYRSETPFFLAVSIGGVTAGILSAPDDPYGGRGVEIWNATDLDRPDRAFDDRHRTSYLAKHPEALRKEGDRRFFAFEPGRTYRVEFVKDDRKAQLFVDGQLRAESEWRLPGGALDGKIVLASFTAGEVDDLRITGTLDPEWLRGR